MEVDKGSEGCVGNGAGGGIHGEGFLDGCPDKDVRHP